jgi:hypothetical protein
MSADLLTDQELANIHKQYGFRSDVEAYWIGRLLDDVAATREEADTQRQYAQSFHERIIEHEIAIKRAEADRDTLLDALTKYGSHDEVCRSVMWRGAATCDCGLDDALARVRSHTRKEIE